MTRLGKPQLSKCFIFLYAMAVFTQRQIQIFCPIIGKRPDWWQKDQNWAACVNKAVVKPWDG
jgi:hypothetical protein